MVLIQARVPLDLARRVKVKAAKEGTTVQKLVTEALEDVLRRRPKEEA